MGNCCIGLDLTGWMGLVLLLPETEDFILDGVNRVNCSVGRAGKQVCRPNLVPVCIVEEEGESRLAFTWDGNAI